MPIRPAQESDLDEIIDLIRALAAYEELAHEVTLDPEVVRGHLFGPDPVASVTMAIDDDGAVVGFALWFRTFSTFLGRSVELDYETIGYDPPTFFACRGVNGRTTATDLMTFTADGDRTQIRYRAEFDFPRPFGLVARLVLRHPVERLADETVEQIRSVLA